MDGTALDQVFALPDEAEQEYLLLGLAKLIRQRGARTFLAAPLLLPEPSYWPDPVEPRGRGVAVLLRRLLSYAGMRELGVEIEIGAKATRGSGRRTVGPPERDPLHHAAGWFMGIEEEVCRFGVSDSSLRDEERPDRHARARGRARLPRTARPGRRQPRHRGAADGSHDRLSRLRIFSPCRAAIGSRPATTAIPASACSTNGRPSATFGRDSSPSCSPLSSWSGSRASWSSRRSCKRSHPITQTRSRALTASSSALERT